VAENADLQYLSELLAQLADDMCLIRSDSAENRASWARFRNGVASLKGDVARLEEKLDPFHEATINRFDRLDDQMRSSSRHPIAEQLSRSEDENANDRNSRWREGRHVLE
jgi:hypothetical protein